MSSKRLAMVIAAIVLVDILYAIYAVYKGPFPISVELGSPTAYLNLYVHVPLAWSSYLLFFIALVLGIAYLAKRNESIDAYIYYTILVGEVYAIATTISGMAWASESWGAAWSWDPRETGVLLLLLAYLGYFAIRNSVSDPDKRKTVSAAYAIAAFTVVPLSFAAAYVTESLHPSMKQTGAYMGNIGPFIGPRVLLATLTAVLLILLLRKASQQKMPRWLSWIAVLVLIIGFAGAFSITSPYLTGNPERVLEAGIDNNGYIHWLYTSTGNHTFAQPVKSPLNPPVTSDGKPSILGHQVIIKQNTISVVRHWSVAFNLAAYTLVVSGLILYAVYTSRREEGEEYGED